MTDREFKLMLSPRKYLLHSQFKAYEVDQDGQEKLHHIGNRITGARINSALFSAKPVVALTQHFFLLIMYLLWSHCILHPKYPCVLSHVYYCIWLLSRKSF